MSAQDDAGNTAKTTKSDEAQGLASRPHGLQDARQRPGVLEQRLPQALVVQGGGGVQPRDELAVASPPAAPRAPRRSCAPGAKCASAWRPSGITTRGADQRELLLEPRHVVRHLVRLGVAVARRPGLHDVGDEDVAAREPGLRQQRVEELPRAADEGAARPCPRSRPAPRRRASRRRRGALPPARCCCASSQMAKPQPLWVRISSCRASSASMHRPIPGRRQGRNHSCWPHCSPRPRSPRRRSRRRSRYRPARCPRASPPETGTRSTSARGPTAPSTAGNLRTGEGGVARARRRRAQGVRPQVPRRQALRRGRRQHRRRLRLRRAGRASCSTPSTSRRPVRQRRDRHPRGGVLHRLQRQPSPFIYRYDRRQPARPRAIPHHRRPASTAPGFNANGIAATPDGKTLILVQSAHGQAVHRRSRHGRRRARSRSRDAGHQRATASCCSGKTLYVVRNQLNQVVKLRLEREAHRRDGRRRRSPTRTSTSRRRSPRRASGCT